MPTESLVLGLLQILVGAGSKIGETIDKNVHVSATKLTNPTKDDCDEADRTKVVFSYFICCFSFMLWICFLLNGAFLF